MIRRLQVRGYRCLRYADLRLDDFHLLVGPNGSGKSAILDAIGFLGDLVASPRLGAVLEGRTPDFRDLVWGRPEDDPGFELAVECDTVAHFGDDDEDAKPAPAADRIFRYELAIRAKDGIPGITSERGLLGPVGASDFGRRRARFPDPPPAPETIFVEAEAGGYRPVLRRNGAGRIRFDPESPERGAEPREMPFSVAPDQSALHFLPNEPGVFPALFGLRRRLAEMRRVFLDPAALRRPAPPTRDAAAIRSDGSNLPWVARRLLAEDEERFGDWLAHVRSAFESVAGVRVVVREEDRRAYLKVRFRNGVEVPSWSVSDGTLRLMAHTLRFYASPPGTLYLIEEPENGVHPHEMQEVLTALAPVAGCQVLVSTHSSAILANAEAKHLLCFAKDEDGVPDVMPVLARQDLEDWIGSPTLSNMHFSGMLGRNVRGSEPAGD